MNSVVYSRNKCFLHSLHLLLFVLFQEFAAIHYLLISGEKSKDVSFYFKQKSLMCLDCSFLSVSITAWISLQRELAASYALTTSCCMFAALKHCDVQSTAGGLSVTITMFATLPSFLPFSKFICEHLERLTFLSLSSETAREILNLVLCARWLAHNWLLERFLSHSVTLMICWLWWRENPLLDDQLWSNASNYYACVKKLDWKHFSFCNKSENMLEFNLEILTNLVLLQMVTWWVKSIAG